MNQKIKKLSIIILAIILLIAGYFVFFQKPETAAADWWDDSWLYRQTVAITNSGTAETDFQVMITLDSATLITANKVQSDCDDIRVTDINGKLIPHWIEPTTCNTATTKIWTKVPSISTSGDTVYLYYGNSAVSSTSSTADTFIREISGVQGAWDMDGTGAIATNDTLADSSGNTNTGTASNVDITGMAYADSQYGQGVDFDGVDDYVNVADNDSLDITGALTLEVWIKTEQHTNTIIYKSWGDSDAPNYDNLYRLYINSNGQLVSLVANSDRTIYLAGNTVINDNLWHHAVGVFDSTTNTLKTYMDGVQRGSTTTTSGVLGTSTIDVSIGARKAFWGGLSGCFNGSIDSVRIYNTALSQSEISDLYGTGGDRHGYVTTNYPNKSLVRKYSASVSVGSPASEERGPGPVAFWKFDEGFGQTANDSTINANNGTLGSTAGSDTNDPTWQTEDMCVSGKCLKFDGVDDYVDGGNIQDLGQEFTIELWSNRSGSTGSYGEIIGIDAPSWSANGGFHLFDENDGRIVARLRNHTDNSEVGVNIETSVPNNEWRHYIITWNKPTLTVYRNGEYVNSISWNHDIGWNNFETFIGKWNSTILFNGFIDSVKIYPYARTAAQIKADYASRGTASGVSAVVSAQGGPLALSQGLVGYWKMDEASWNGTADEVVDSSGSGNDGVAVGATGIPTTGAGKFGNGGVFDGVDDYVSIPTNGASKDIGTISFWLNKKELTSSGYMVTTSGTSQRIYFVSSTNTIHYALGDPQSTIGSYNILSGTWYHMTGIWDNGDASLFVNGQLISSDTYTPLTGVQNPMKIGSFGGDQGFNGSIDSVRIYNRALSPGEVRDLYNFAPGPVGWWKMDEKVSGNGQTINDSSGYGNTGTTSSADGTGMDCMVPGKYGSACEFDGVDDYVDAGNDASLDITDDISISFWVKTSSNNQNNRLVSKANAGTVTGYEVSLDFTGNGQLKFGTLDGTWNELTSSQQISDDLFHFITATYQKNGGTNNKKIYYDGVVVAQTTDADGIVDSGGNLYIGNLSGAGNHFNGSIDDVRIYNYARTPSQIIEDYSAGAGRKQPIGHWKFDEGYGTTANNSGIGGSSLNGTLTNMSSPATATSGWTDSGKIGKGLVFDGGDDYVDCGYNSSLDFKGADKSFTTEAWININSLVVDGGIVGRFYFSGSDQYILKFESDTNDIKFAIRDDSGYQIAESAANTISTNVWTHIVGVADSGTLQVYINGVTSGTIATYATIVDIGTEESLEIGVDNRGGGVQWFNGSIDDVKIYNYALTEDEVRKEYNQGALLKLGSTGTDSSGNVDDSASREYCIPGDTSTCNPPVGRWDFNEGTGSTVNDISGNNNTGIWNGTGSHWTTGKIGKGGSFNGSDDYVDCGNNESLNITDAITISAWANIYALDSSYGNIVYKSDTTYGIRKSNTDKLQFVIGGIAAVDSSDAITNKFIFITGVWDKNLPANNIKLYVNGEIVGQGNKGTSLSTDSKEVGIGAKHTITWYENFKGSIDQVRIYDYARTPAQIAWDYNRGKPVAHWKFDECQGGTANDASGNGNDGTITIGATGTQDGIGTCTDGDTSNAWYNGRSGKYNSAMSFDGSDDYVDAGNDASLDITDAITVEAWVNIADLPADSGTSIYIMGKSGSYDLELMGWGVGEGSKRIYFQNAYAVWSEISSPKNTWIQIIGIKNGTNDYIYINSILQHSGTSSLVNNANNVFIGYKATRNHFNGSIDEVKIYNYALTAEQVKTEYNGGAVNFR